jgi:hypothetical protein
VKLQNTAYDEPGVNSTHVLAFNGSEVYSDGDEGVARRYDHESQDIDDYWEEERPKPLSEVSSSKLKFLSADDGEFLVEVRCALPKAANMTYHEAVFLCVVVAIHFLSTPSHKLSNS